MLIFSLANVLHQSLEPEDAAKVLLLHFCTILRSLLTDYLLFFCDHCPTVLPRWVQPGTLQCYISLRVFQREGPNTNDIDHHLVGRLTKFNLLPGARGCRGPRSNRIGEGSSWIIILSQRELCWTIMMILKYSEYDHIFHMKEGENEDNGDKACTCAVLRVSWPISKHVNILKMFYFLISAFRLVTTPSAMSTQSSCSSTNPSQVLTMLSGWWQYVWIEIRIKLNTYVCTMAKGC